MAKLRSFNFKQCLLCLFFFMLFMLCFLLLLTLIVPIIFMYSEDMQRFLVFPTYYIKVKNYTNLNDFPIKGVRNYYVTVNKEENITLGIWHVLPSELVLNDIPNEQYDYEKILSSGKYDIILYLHGNGQDRTDSIGLYTILRKYFNVIICDYRGYADSSNIKSNEFAVVDDVVRLYKSIRNNNTHSRIYVWGHSLGTAVALHSAAALKQLDIIPSGIVLEAPFTSFTDIMINGSMAKYLDWLPWFESTIINPMIKNGYHFNSQSYILNVYCPIMMMHAKDDDVIPYRLATKLFNIANSKRNVNTQGSITYYLLDAVGYGHEFLYETPNIHQYIRTFINETRKFEENKNNTMS